jgi:hypothetical protein
MLYLKFRYLEYVKFAQFELWPSDGVDLQAYYDRQMLPRMQIQSTKYPSTNWAFTTDAPLEISRAS